MRSRICAGDRTAVRAAASSMARGRPSSASHRRAVGSSGARPERSAKSLTASAAASDDTWISTSSRSRRRSRLVARTCRFGHRSTSFATSVAAGNTRSKLSRRRSSSRSPMCKTRSSCVPRTRADCLKHELRFPERRETDPEDARLELRHQLGCSLECESCLPGTARAVEGDETRAAADARHDFGDVCLAADEGARRSREVRVRDRLERRKLPLPELEERNRLVEVLQPVLAEVEERGTVVEVVPRRL